MAQETGLVYDLGADNLLPSKSIKELGGKIITTVLTMGDAVVSDSWGFANYRLRKFLQTWLGKRLLRDNHLRIALRDISENFSLFAEGILSKGTAFYGVKGTPEEVMAYARFLDKTIRKPTTFSFGPVTGAFESFCGKIMTPDALTNLGISSASAERVIDIFLRAPVFTRSHMLTDIKPLFLATEQDTFMEAVNVIYGLGLPTALGMGLNVPPGMAKKMDGILSTIYDKLYVAGSIGITGGEGSFAFSSVINDPAIGWFFDQAIYNLRIAEFEVAVTSDGRFLYLRALTQFLQNPTGENWENFLVFFRSYFSFVGNEVFKMRSKKGNPGEPATEDVTVTGRQSIQVVTQSRISSMGAIQEGQVRLVGESLLRPSTLIL